jgi:hypothetical protein
MMLRDPLSELGGWLSLAGLMALFLIWYVRRWHARKRKFWAPLAPIVNGVARGTRMVGTYERHAVVAEISPVSDTGPRSPNNSPWVFCASLDTMADRNQRQRRRTLLEPVGVDWEVRYEGRDGWRIVTRDDRIKQELTRAGLPADIRQWDTYPTITYSARSKLISISEDFPDQMTPERFRSRLILLLRLAHLNQELNVT